jgi:hypothetical protein
MKSGTDKTDRRDRPTSPSVRPMPFKTYAFKAALR